MPALAEASSRETKDAIAELFCPRAAQILNGFRGSLGKKNEDVLKDGHLMLAYEVHSFGVNVLFELKPDIEVALEGYVPKMFFDEFLHGLWIMVHRKTLPSWLVFACQIYIDIFDITYREPSPGYTELQKRIE